MPQPRENTIRDRSDAHPREHGHNQYAQYNDNFQDHPTLANARCACSNVFLSPPRARSSFPTAGGLYYWAAKLAPDGKAPVWSWFTGWFNLLGQVAVTASIDFAMATFCGFFLNLTTGFQGTAKSLFGIYTLVLIAHGILNSLGVNIIAKLNNISVWWHLIGVVVIVGALFILPDAHKHQSISNVFTKYYDGLGWGFGGHAIWVVLVGLMMAQYTLTGYDASAHMTEETRDAATSGPRGIMTSIWVSVVAGLVLMIGLTYAIPYAIGSDAYVGRRWRRHQRAWRACGSRRSAGTPPSSLF